MLKILWAALAATAIGSAALGTVALGQPAPIRVGVTNALSGPAAFDGQVLLDGVRTMTALINERGGVLGRPLELKIYDDRNVPEEAISAVRRAMDQDHVDWLIGPGFSSMALAVKPIVKDKILMMVHAAQNPDVTKDAGSLLFRQNLMTPMMAEQYTKIICNRIKPTSVAFIAVNDDFGRAEVPTYSKSLQETCGIKTTAAEYINVTDTDFTTVLTRIRSTNPGAIYVAIGSSSVAAVVYRQIRQVGFKGTVLCSPSNVTPKLVELAGKAIDGVQTLLFYPVQSDNPMLKAWEQTYRRMIKAEPSHGNALGAQSIELLAYAAEKAGDPRNYKKMAEILRSGPIPTIIGDITFDASGQGHQDIHLVVIRDGKIQAVK